MNSEVKFGLSQYTIDKINSVFSNYKSIEKVIIYGSRAKGTQRLGSDIDLTVIAPSMNTSELLGIESKLDDFLLPYKIDLNLFHQIENSDLVEHIKRVGQSFYVPT